MQWQRNEHRLAYLSDWMPHSVPLMPSVLGRQRFLRVKQLANLAVDFTFYDFQSTFKTHEEKHGMDIEALWLIPAVILHVL